MGDNGRFAANLPSKFVAPTQSGAAADHTTRARGVSNASSRIQRASITIGDSDPVHGGAHGTSRAGSAIPTDEHPRSIAQHSAATGLDGTATMNSSDGAPHSAGSAAPGSNKEALAAIAPNRSAELPLQGDDAHLYRPYENGYHFPPKYTTKESMRQGAVSFWKFFTTPVGFLIVLYSLNVVAWGAMIFFLLLNAAPAMCYPSCDDIDSPRRKWVEYTAQILTALFSVTGFGLAPWRFRDIFWLLKFRLFGDFVALRRLAGIHRGWVRLAGSQNIPVDIGPDNIPAETDRAVLPFPESKMSDCPLTGVRAPPTKLWKLDFILWNNMFNTFAQAGLSGIMWGMDRYTRPSWATGFLVAIACIVGAIGGLGELFQGKAVKAVEGVPLTEEDKEKLAKDQAQGIYHYNNIKAKKPKEKKHKDVEGGEKR